ncbi:anti-sigma factor family protein [Saccharothrix australiensis]|uniref:Putative zinc finger protein n=1 Tax=Saccharothrix australiensis TaxID=2072 RepID=A0A495W3G5_9PSEU|nr:zf-HC2 domain-containing protein [Saccharothrix australiensis]RKT56216.1 putative zinc finger protein [Saccharothrix australiensis]
MTPRPDHVDVAAYVLGILDEDEVDAFENHLAQCRRCALDLRDLAVLPDLLDEADANGMLRGNAGERPDGRSVRAMLDSVSRERSRRRRDTALLSAVAAVLLVALTAAVTVSLTPSSDDVRAAPTTSSAEAAPAEEFPTEEDPAEADSTEVPGPTAVAKNAPEAAGTFTRTDSATGVRASVTATSHPWGTAVTLEAKGVKGPTRCELVANSRAGETVVVGSWLVDPSTPDGPPLHLDTSVGMRWQDIAEFSVRDTRTNATLVRLPTD